MSAYQLQLADSATLSAVRARIPGAWSMKDDRNRVPLAAEYARALGVATYCFANLEWNVVWCCERLRGGTLRKLLRQRDAAGAIGVKFKDLTRNMPPSQHREQLKELAERFLTLVNLRNSILHGKPCTAPSGEQRLSSGSILETADLEGAADDFADCGIKLNALLHGFLNTYSASAGN